MAAPWVVGDYGLDDLVRELECAEEGPRSTPQECEALWAWLQKDAGHAEKYCKARSRLFELLDGPRGMWAPLQEWLWRTRARPQLARAMEAVVSQHTRRLRAVLWNNFTQATPPELPVDTEGTAANGSDAPTAVSQTFAAVERETARVAQQLNAAVEYEWWTLSPEQLCQLDDAERLKAMDASLLQGLVESSPVGTKALQDPEFVLKHALLIPPGFYLKFICRETQREMVDVRLDEVEQALS